MWPAIQSIEMQKNDGSLKATIEHKKENQGMNSTTTIGAAPEAILSPLSPFLTQQTPVLLLYQNNFTLLSHI